MTWSKDAYAKKYEVKYTKRDSQGKAVTDDPVVVSTKKTTVTISGLTTGSIWMICGYDALMEKDGPTGLTGTTAVTTLPYVCRQ